MEHTTMNLFQHIKHTRYNIKKFKSLSRPARKTVQPPEMHGLRVLSTVPVYNSFLKEEVIYRYRISPKNLSFRLTNCICKWKLGNRKWFFICTQFSKWIIFLYIWDLGTSEAGRRALFVHRRVKWTSNSSTSNMKMTNFWGNFFVKNTLEYLDLLKLGFLISRCSS